MGTELARRSSGNGVIPAVCSALIPGLGQLVNGQTEKAIGVFAIYTVMGAGLLGALPLLGPIAGVAAGVTWIYGVADGYIQGKKKR